MINQKPADWITRENIVKSTEDVIVLASAGSGKTTILVEKLHYECAKAKDHYCYAAITFTNKAATEISDKLTQTFSPTTESATEIEPNFSKNIIEKTFCTTIDGFVDAEILKNYFHAVYHDYPDYEITYLNQYKFSSFDNGLKQLKEQGKLGKYVDSYSNQGFNFKYQLALKILENSQAACEYLKYKYKIFFVDEYQDSDYSMHQLFIYLKEKLGIRLFLVGDLKQSIYQWRGAKPELLNSLSKSGKYEVHRLTENFRSHRDIIEFSRITRVSEIESVTYPFYKENRVLYYNPDIQDKTSTILKLIDDEVIDLSEKTLVLVGHNQHINNIHQGLGGENSGFSIRLSTLIDEVPNHRFLQSICKYYYNSDYTEYDFVDEVLFEWDNKIVNTVSTLLDSFVSSKEISTLESLYDIVGFSIEEYESRLETEILLEMLETDNYKNAFIEDENNLILTTHSAKGLESEQVIVFTDYLLNRNNVLKNEEHYVAITRAKEKLVLIDGSGQYKNCIEVLINRNNSNFKFSDFVNEIN
jgi:superfamily I DNA/RNA helicase